MISPITVNILNIVRVILIVSCIFMIGSCAVAILDINGNFGQFVVFGWFYIFIWGVIPSGILLGLIALTNKYARSREQPIIRTELIWLSCSIAGAILFVVASYLVLGW